MIFLKNTDEKKALVHLGLKILLGWTFFFALLLSLRFFRGSVPKLIYRTVGAASGVVMVWVTFGPLIDLANYHIWPGCALVDNGIVIKPENSFKLRRYRFRKVVSVQRIEIKYGEKNRYYLALIFTDGTEWKTKPQERLNITLYVEVGHFIARRSRCSVYPAFEAW